MEARAFQPTPVRATVSSVFELLCSFWRFERFQEKWKRFSGSKARPSNDLEPLSDSEKGETAPVTPILAGSGLTDSLDAPAISANADADGHGPVAGGGEGTANPGPNLDAKSSVNGAHPALSDPEAMPAKAGVSTTVRRTVDTAARQDSANRLKFFRATRPEEIALVEAVVREYHAESRYAHIPFSKEKFGRFFRHQLRDPENTLAVYVRQGDRTVALMSAEAGDYLLGIGGRMVMVNTMYVS
ncbi:MAG TPA: hypothetical protein VIL84_09275 [Devosiaceae bacterium]